MLAPDDKVALLQNSLLEDFLPKSSVSVFTVGKKYDHHQFNKYSQGQPAVTEVRKAIL